MLVDVEPAHLAQNPIVWQRLRPCGIDHETRRLAGARCVVHAGLLEEPVKRAIVLQEIAIGVGGHRPGWSLPSAAARPSPCPGSSCSSFLSTRYIEAGRRKPVVQSTMNYRAAPVSLSPTGNRFCPYRRVCRSAEEERSKLLESALMRPIGRFCICLSGHSPWRPPPSCAIEPCRLRARTTIRTFKTGATTFSCRRSGYRPPWQPGRGFIPGQLQRPRKRSPAANRLLYLSSFRRPALLRGVLFPTVSGEPAAHSTQLQRFRSQGHRGSRSGHSCPHCEKACTLTFRHRQGVRTGSPCVPLRVPKPSPHGGTLGFIVDGFAPTKHALRTWGSRLLEPVVLLERTSLIPVTAVSCIPQSTLGVEGKVHGRCYGPHIDGASRSTIF